MMNGMSNLVWVISIVMQKLYKNKQLPVSSHENILTSGLQLQCSAWGGTNAVPNKKETEVFIILPDFNNNVLVESKAWKTRTIIPIITEVNFVLPMTNA